jgi:hypothetical protein
MSTLTWSALGFFLIVLVGGSAAVGGLGLVFWRQLQRTLAASSEEMDALTTGLETLDAKLVRVQGGSTELGDAAGRLSRSVTKARVLLGAAQESRDAIAGWIRLAGWLRLLARL